MEKELKETISDLSKKLSADRIFYIHQKIEQLLRRARLVSVSTEVILSQDHKGNHYLCLCQEGKADCLITGDKDLLAIPKETLEKNGMGGLIVSPHQFLEYIL